MYVKPCIKDIVRIGGRQGRHDFLRLDMNENPGGLPGPFVEEVKRELTPEFLAMYPEESRMKRLLADYLSGTVGGVRVTEENLCLTNGSDLGIRYLYEIFAEPGSAVVTVTPSFEMYRIYSLVFGLRHRPVMIGPEGGMPVASILEAIQEDTDIVVLLNPNNPFGRPFYAEEFEQIAQKAASVGALVVVDEAYHYFYRTTFLEEALAKENVAVLRTFSKVMSLAGCRLGFIAANPYLIEYVHHVRPSCEVNSVALKFGERLLEQPWIITQMQEEAQAGKDYLTEDLKGHGYEVIEQEGNFIFVRPRHLAAGEAAKRLEQEAHVLVKTYGSPLLKDYLRISTGARPFMARFLEAFYRIDRI